MGGLAAEIEAVVAIALPSEDMIGFLNFVAGSVFSGKAVIDKIAVKRRSSFKKGHNILLTK